jgi:anti-anti-sigma regulatory factor
MSAPTEWRPSGAMTIEHAATLWADAASHLANASDVGAGAMRVMHVDLSAVERLDTAGCQILLACREEARRRTFGWRLTGCTPHAVDVMRLLGCDGILGATTDSEETER